MSKSKYKSTLHACYLGYITQALIINLTPLFFVIFQDEFGLTYTMLGSLVLIMFVTQLAVDALSIRLIAKVGQRLAVVAAHGFAAVGMIALAVLPNVLTSPYVGIVIPCILCSIGGGLIEVLISPIVESLPGDAKASSMSLLHSFYSWGQVLVIILTTLALRITGPRLWYLLPLMWSLLPIFTLVKFTRVPLVPMVEEDKRTPLKTLFKSKVFLLALLMMICSGASEMSMSQWASLFAEKGLGISKTLGDLLGPCMFAVMMGAVRTWYGVKGQKISMHKALLICSVLCMASFVITAIAPIPAVSLLGCALCGLSVSLMWPGMLSITAAGYPAGGVAMFAILALGGDLGCSIGPQFTGIVADRSSLHWGLLAAIIFPIVMLIGLIVLKAMLDAKEA